MKTYTALVGIGIGVVAVLGVLITLDISKVVLVTEDYAIHVDPLIDKQSLFTMARVTIQNIGSKPLTNVKINFGGGDILDLGTLDKGEKIIVSPPPENAMQFVQVSADHDIFVSKAYRTPPKMVGMMGS